MSALAGHGLLNEGAAFHLVSDALGTKWFERARPGTTAGNGMGRCTCGESSPDLASGNQRRKWHREHKDQIRSTR